MRTCRYCFKQFENLPGWSNNRQCCSEECVARRRLNAHLKHKYKITLAEYEEILQKQGGVCAICRRSTPNGGNSNWSVDHDHETQRVRGLLCTNCNLLLGHARDNVELLRAVINYLIEKKTTA